MKEDILSWPIGIIAVSLYAFSCFKNNLYGEFILQFLYIAISVFGWMQWKKTDTSSLKISHLKSLNYKYVFFSALFLSFGFYLLLDYLQSSLPKADAISNGFSIVATYLAAKKKIENWILWIPINILIATMMWFKGMPFYMMLYICYGLFAIYGYINWLKISKTQV